MHASMDPSAVKSMTRRRLIHRQTTQTSKRHDKLVGRSQNKTQITERNERRHSITVVDK